MEKKNINIGVVRTCTILLLTVFTIGRKYGQGQNAEDLIKGLEQQPCACCLNFENVAEVAKGIDNAKEQLQNDKNILARTNNQLRQDKEELIDQKGRLEGQLQETKKQTEMQEVQLREEIQNRENENKGLENEINNLKNGKNENAGAAQVAKELDLKWSDYAEKLSELKVYKEKLENNIRDINAEKINLGKELNENKQILQGKILELDNTKKEIEDLKKTKEKIESDLKTKNEEIEKYKKENGQLIEEKKKLENELKELEKKYKKNYESTVEKNDKIVGENTEATNNIKDLLEKWKKENEKLMIDINEKKKKL